MVTFSVNYCVLSVLSPRIFVYLPIISSSPHFIKASFLNPNTSLWSWIGYLTCFYSFLMGLYSSRAYQFLNRCEKGKIIFEIISTIFRSNPKSPRSLRDSSIILGYSSTTLSVFSKFYNFSLIQGIFL